MHRPVLWLAVAVAVASCAEDVPTMRWAKPGASYEEFVADREACVQQSKAQSGTYYIGGVRYRGNPHVLDPGVFLPCMHARGYAADPKGYAAPPGEEIPLGP
jgi:hypothetical protein